MGAIYIIRDQYHQGGPKTMELNPCVKRLPYPFQIFRDHTNLGSIDIGETNTIANGVIARYPMTCISEMLGQVVGETQWFRKHAALMPLKVKP